MSAEAKAARTKFLVFVILHHRLHHTVDMNTVIVLSATQRERLTPLPRQPGEYVNNVFLHLQLVKVFIALNVRHRLCAFTVSINGIDFVLADIGRFADVQMFFAGQN